MTGVYRWGWGDGPRAVALWGWAGADSTGVGFGVTPYRVVPSSGGAAVAGILFGVSTANPDRTAPCSTLPPALIPVAAVSSAWPKAQNNRGGYKAAPESRSGVAAVLGKEIVLAHGSGGKLPPAVDGSRAGAVVSRSGGGSKAAKG